jgi:putative ATP-binding cassette transporter
MQDLLRLIRFLLRPTQSGRSSRGMVVILLLTGAIGGVASAGLVVLINRVLRNTRDLNMEIVWGFAALCVIMPLARFFSQKYLVRLSQAAMLDLRMQLTRCALHAPLRRLEEIGPYRVLAALTEDTSTIREVLTGLPVLIMNLVVVFGCLLYLGWISPLMLLIVLGFLTFAVLTYRLAVNQAVPFFRRVREGSDRLVKAFRGLVEGIKELKLHQSRRVAFLDQLLAETRAVQHDTTRGSTIHAAANSWGQALSFVLLVLIFFLGVQGRISRDVLVSTVLIILYMRAPIDVIVQMIPGLNRATIAMQKVSQLGLWADGGDSWESDIPMAEVDPGWSSLELVGVTHSYRRDQEESIFLLGPIDLRFEPGEVVFLVGGNGSGKTTLAKLILGLYSPESGEIRLDGRAVGDADREGYRQRFSAVFSDFHLFDSLLGLEGKPDLEQQVRTYLSKLHLETKVRVDKGALSTIELSQGQRKRLALLTAYLEDRPIYLFDEWAADQDPYFKGIFYLELLPELKARGKTVIVISHDDRYYRVADRVIKLDYGRVESDSGAAGPPPADPAYLQPPAAIVDEPREAR